MAMLSKRKWPLETEMLRSLLRGFPLQEQTKWDKPCFSLESKNIVLIQGFNAYIALMFFKGALLKDAKKLLAQPGQHQSVRQLRFVDEDEMRAKAATVKAYVAEAVKIERAGLKVKLRAASDYSLPAELEHKFKEIPALQKAFKLLTPGRQKAYILYFSAAKQAQTREARIERYVPHILKGLGMLDR